MKWNVVATAHEHHFTEACRFLETYGSLQRTNFFNVMMLDVEDVDTFLQQIHRQSIEQPELTQAVARLVPVSYTFNFQSAAEFEEKVKETVAHWTEPLADTRFHVRMHRRGFKGRLSGQHEERFLDFFLLEKIREHGASAELDFDDPDYILAVETIGQQCGVSLWSRELLRRYPLLKLD